MWSRLLPHSTPRLLQTLPLHCSASLQVRGVVGCKQLFAECARVRAVSDERVDDDGRAKSGAKGDRAPSSYVGVALVGCGLFASLLVGIVAVRGARRDHSAGLEHAVADPSAFLVDGDMADLMSVKEPPQAVMEVTGTASLLPANPLLSTTPMSSKPASSSSRRARHARSRSNTVEPFELPTERELQVSPAFSPSSAAFPVNTAPFADHEISTRDRNREAMRRRTLSSSEAAAAERWNASLPPSVHRCRESAPQLDEQTPVMAELCRFEMSETLRRRSVNDSPTPSAATSGNFRIRVFSEASIHSQDELPLRARPSAGLHRRNGSVS